MPRIVSLIASATEIVDALGQTENLVGRSHECDYPEIVKTLPVCTRPRIAVDASSREIDRAVKESARTSVSIYDVFDDVIESLEPTHIITQVQCDVCAVSLRDVEIALARGMKGGRLLFRCSLIRWRIFGGIFGAWLMRWGFRSAVGDPLRSCRAGWRLLVDRPEACPTGRLR